MRVRKLYNEGGEIASTILQQLGGANRLHAMTGAYNFVNLGNGLSFKIKNQRANYIKITLTSMDLYDVEVGRIRGNTYKVVSEGKGMYAEELKPFIEKSTGMYLTLGRGFSKGGMISVKSHDGEDLFYKIDTDEKYIEVDENTKKYLSDIALVMDRNFRKLKDTYIFWYDDMSDSDITELEEVFQTSFNIFAKGGKVKKKRVKFVDKVESIADRLNGTKVPKRLKKDYGVRYNRTESEEAARRIAGAQLRDRKMAEGGVISEDLSNYVRLYYKTRLDSDTAASNGNLAHSIRLDDKADDYRNDAKRLIDDYNEKNNTYLSINDFNIDGTLKIEIGYIEDSFDLEYLGKYGNKFRFKNRDDGSIIEIDTYEQVGSSKVKLNLWEAVSRYYQENYKHGGEMAFGGNVDEDDTFVMLFKGYGFVEKRGSYGTRTFYNIEHNAKIYYDPKYRSISGYVGGGEGNDEVIPYSVDGVLDFFIEHDITESEATPMADGGKIKEEEYKKLYTRLKQKKEKGETLDKREEYALNKSEYILKTRGKMADGGNVWDEDLNVYTLVSSKEYFGSDTASDKRRWFRRNGRGLSREQAKRMAQDYIDRYGRDRVYIGNIRHYR